MLLAANPLRKEIAHASKKRKLIDSWRATAVERAKSEEEEGQLTFSMSYVTGMSQTFSSSFSSKQ